MARRPFARFVPSNPTWDVPFQKLDMTMPLAEQPRRGRTIAVAKRGPGILAALSMGASIEEIAATERMSPKRVEKLLREELQRCWVAPAQDYARLQIFRLQKVSKELIVKAKEGHLPSVDRYLRVLDRLDRYHGFSKLTPVMTNEYAGMHERLMAKINRNVARLPPPGEDVR